MSLPRFSVHNEVLVNMLMVVVFVGGGLFAVTLTRELFPETQPDKILIQAVYPGVQPAEIEKAVTIKIEEAVRNVDGVEKVDSSIGENFSFTVCTLRNDVKDVDTVLQEIKTEVDAIDDLPDELEQRTVRKLVPKLPVIGVALYGDDNEAALKKAARDLRDELLKLPGITEVEVGGIRDDEISVEVRPERLYEYDVSFQEVADAIARTNLDISGGQLKGQRTNIAVRTLGEETRGIDLEDIVVRTRPEGAKVYLRDVATVHDGFVDTDAESWFNGQRSVNLMVYKVGDQDVLQICNVVKAFIKGKQQVNEDFSGWTEAWNQRWYWRPFALMGNAMWRAVVAAGAQPDPQKVYLDSRQNPFSHNYQVALHTDLARYLQGRLDLMLRNGAQGFVLVVLSLLFFLDWRVAFWTAFGIPTSFLGSFFVMWLCGVSIDLISLFGMIIVLGIIVDDAIIVGENIYRHVQEGMPPRQAAIVGAEEVMWPVAASVTTTVGAFAPLLFMQGQIGDFFGELPIVIMAALSVSLLEALLILPAHLKHLPTREQFAAKHERLSRGIIGAIRRGVDAFTDWFSHSRAVKAYERFLTLALEWRYVTVAIAVASLPVAVGLVLGGIVEWQFLQKIDSETLVANLEMPIGTPAYVVRDRLRTINDAAQKMPEVRNVQMHIAVQFSVGPTGAESFAGASHLGQMIIELEAADERERKKLRTSEQVLTELRELSDALPGVNSVSWIALSGGPAGKDIEVVLTGPQFDALVECAGELKQKLAAYQGTVDIEDNIDRGRREVQLQLREAARPTGITVGMLGDHVRSAMFGKEVRRITRNREDVKIMVRYPESFRTSVYNLESMWIPTGSTVNQRGWVPLKEVAELRETEGYGTLHRSQQNRSVKLLADVQEGASSDDIRAGLTKYFQTEVQPRYPGVTMEFQGVAEEQAKSLDSLKVAMPLALIIIYAIVAAIFRSYYQPVVVMLTIPFGMCGAIVGHWLTGYPVTIISAIGFVALTGIVVNDAIVLVDYVNVCMRQGLAPFAANLEGSKTRLRAIFLTSETTIAGLLPMMFENSFQAKFLIPMAITISFGLLFSTIQTLVIVPSINMIFFDVIAWMGRPLIAEEDILPARAPAVEP